MKILMNVVMDNKKSERKVLIAVIKKKLGICRIRDVNIVSDKEFLRNFMQLQSLIMLNGISYSEIGTNREEFEFLEARAKLKVHKPQQNPQPQNPHQD